MRLKIRSASLLFLAITTLPATAMAQLTPYVFGGMGELSQDSTDTVTRAGFGVEASAVPLVTPGVEASYFHSGQARGAVLNAKIDWPIGLIGLDPFVKAGMAKVGTDNANSEAGMTMGVGFEIDLLDWGFRLEADHYEVAGASNVSTITGNLLYQF